MIKAASTFIHIRERLHPGLLDGLVRTGAQAIEIFAFRGHFDYANRRQHVLEIATWFKSTGIPLNSMHSPMYNSYKWGARDMEPISICEVDKKARIEAQDEIKRALEIAEHIPFRFLVQHVGKGGEEFDERKMDAAMACVEHLRAFAKPLGVSLVLENIPNEMSTPDRLRELIHAGHFEDVGICFDVGHAHVMNTVAEDFQAVKDIIRTTHVHDNNKDRDSHLWPGQGSIDWDEAMRLLRSAPLAPPLLLEIEGETAGNVDQGFQQAFEKLDRAVEARA